MPAPIVLSTLTPETKKVVNPPTGQPVIATKAEFRDGSRPTSGPGSSNWLSHSQVSRAPAPLLRFTDLISGPATGLGDGLGSGVIVTIWAQGVGDSQGTGQVYFTDFAGTKRPAEHVYYWKRADGELPSGPARLWYSHLMQEIAFSIPAGSVDGLGQITVETGGQTSNAMPFTVRAGDFLFVDNSGNDSATGTFSDPLRTYNSGAKSLASAGTTIYYMDVDINSPESPDLTSTAAIYTNTGVQATEANHLFMAGYPGTRARVFAKRCTGVFNSTGLCYAKLALYSLSHEEDSNGQLVSVELGTGPGPICLASSRYGRGIANLCMDISNYCSSGQGGAISGGRDDVEAFKIYGNEVADYSCAGASKLHHTTYMTIRDIGNNPQYEAWEWDFNFLHGNAAKFGIHNYDERDFPGDLTTPLNIKHNVIVEQGGAGISLGNSSAPNGGWSMDCYIENNLMIDVGGPAAWNGIDPNTVDGGEVGGISIKDKGLLGTIRCADNLIYRYSEHIDGGNPINAFGALAVTSDLNDLMLEWRRNVAYTAFDFPFVGPEYNPAPAGNLIGNDNCWHYTGQSPANATIPTFDTAPIITDPQVTFDGAIAIVASTSPLKGRGLATGYDIYGVPRSTYQTVGPVEALS